MLALFRNNQFTTAIPLALYVMLTHASTLLGYTSVEKGEVPAGAGVLYQMWFAWLADYPYWSSLLAVVLVFAQAMLVNMLADEFRLLGDRTWLPGVFYALAAACQPDFLLLTPPLIAATFVPMILRRIFKAYNQPKATSLVFDAAFWTTVAALFYPPAIFLLIPVYLGFTLIRSYTFREQVVSVTGVLTALFLCWLWYFWTDRGMDFWQVQFVDLAGLYGFDDWKINSKTGLKWLLPTLFCLVILLNYGNYVFRKLIQIQKYVNVLYLVWFVGGLAFVIQEDPFAPHFMLLAAPTGVFLAMSFSTFRKRSLAELFHLVLLGYVIFIQFFKLAAQG